MWNGKFHLEFFPNEDETRKNIKFRFEEFFGFLTVCLIKLQKSHVHVISVIWMQNTQKLALGLMNSSLRKYLWYYTWPMCQPYNHSVKGTRTSNFHVADQKRSGMHVQDMRHCVLCWVYISSVLELSTSWPSNLKILDTNLHWSCFSFVSLQLTAIF